MAETRSVCLTWLSRSQAGGHLGCRRSLATLNEATVDVHVPVLFEVRSSCFLDGYLRGGPLGPVGRGAFSCFPACAVARSGGSVSSPARGEGGLSPSDLLHSPSSSWEPA